MKIFKALIITLSFCIGANADIISQTTNGGLIQVEKTDAEESDKAPIKVKEGEARKVDRELIEEAKMNSKASQLTNSKEFKKKKASIDKSKAKLRTKKQKFKTKLDSENWSKDKYNSKMEKIKTKEAKIRTKQKELIENLLAK